MPKKLRVQDIHCFVSIDQDGNEGIIATRNDEKQMWMPMIFSDPKFGEIFREEARKLGQASNVTVKLLRFGARQEIETLYEGKA